MRIVNVPGNFNYPHQEVDERNLLVGCYEPHDYHMMFAIFECAIGLDGDEEYADVAIDYRNVVQNQPIILPLIHGSIKWDGCSDLSLGDLSDYVNW